MDEDHKRILETALQRDRALRRDLDDRSKQELDDDYYLLFEIFQSYVGVFLGSVWSKQLGVAESLLRGGLKILTNEAYDIHYLAATANYYAVFRELRYLLEFAKRAAFLDKRMSSSSLRNKLVEYEKRQNRDDRSFRGRGLLDQLSVIMNPKLTTKEQARIHVLFKVLSAHAHGSFEEVSLAAKGAPMGAGYDKSKFLRVVEYAAGVSDVYLCLMERLGYVNRDILTLGKPLQNYFPLSWARLGAK